jgi:hypothetical protein
VVIVGSVWPALRVDEWTETRDTLHMWTQIVGKVRMSGAPLVNHWWNVTLYVSPRGLTTSAVPNGADVFDIEFDFFDELLVIRHSSGERRTVRLEAKPVADFYAETLAALSSLGITAEFQARPNEVDPSIPFAEDRTHSAYDSEAVRLYWQQLVQASRVMNEFRSRFVGKVSPVHYFWGAPDLACTRFSGRSAPTHTGGAPNCGDWVMVEGYSHELSSCGFWAGGGEEGAFYAYAYPEPDGFADHPIANPDAYYYKDGGQFLLPYEAVRQADDPDQALLSFLQSTYEAAAVHGHWNRSALEVDPARWDHKLPDPPGR